MSYRSIKRVLGETNLERKCRLLFGVCLFLLIAASFWFYGDKTKEIVNEQNRTTGLLLTRADMMVRHWRRLESQAGYGLIAKQLSDSFGEQRTQHPGEGADAQPYEVEFILPNISPPPANENVAYRPPADQFERNVLDRFLAKKPGKPVSIDEDESDGRMSQDGSKYYYYQAIRANSRTCTTGCHQSVAQINLDPALGAGPAVVGRSTATADGDLMAVARLALSTDQTRRKIATNYAILIATAIITMFLAMVALYVIVRYVIVKPLRHLRDVSDAVSRGNATLRAEIHTGDEFEDLATAFNRMLRHLISAQEDLRQANTNLDGKVDELAQANMRLYELNMLKSDFLATMSHELRTPLNSILGFSEVLGSIDALDDKQKRYVQNIQKSGKTLLEMINDILDLAKIESGKMETRLTDFRVGQVVTAQCDMARPLTERKNIDLESRIEPDLPPMHQDQARVQQVLNNLLSNAIKFTPEGGRITVAVRRDEANFMVLDVIDTGVGIAEQDQQTIFEKFRQGRTAVPSGDAMTREYSGSGLGLSIVKELCRLLGGEVSVHSELGKGSTFTVRLPWVLQDQPRLDSALVEGFDEFAKQRFDVGRERVTETAT
jgi:two-component system, NarL family, sensor histidine kinase BarA